MKELPVFSNEDSEHYPNNKARKITTKQFLGIVCFILGVVIVVCAYWHERSEIEMKVKGKYSDQITTLEKEINDLENEYKEKLENQRADYEGKLESQKKSYEKKLATEKENSKKDLEKKDDIISEKDAEIERLIAENMVNFNEIESEIKAVGKLTTIDYHYTYAGTHEDIDDFFGINLPWTANSFIAQWDGVVALGVDLSKVTISVNESSKIITVSVPNAETFYHDVDEDSFKVLDERNNIFNPITVEDFNAFNKLYEEKIFEKIEENRILEDAYKNAQVMIENILKAVPQIAENYTIQYKELQ